MNRSTLGRTAALTHISRLESESIHIMREVVAECERPVMLYSVGKDSAVMLHLARKAFYPTPAAVPLAARRYHVEVPGHVRNARPDGARQRHAIDRLSKSGGRAARHQSVRPRPAAHRYVEDRGAEAGSDQYNFDAAFGARAATRKSPAPRSASFPSARPISAGIRRVSGPNSGACTTPEGQGREHPGVSDLELDRTRRLAIHPAARTSRSCRCISRRRARRSMRDGLIAHGRRRSISACVRARRPVERSIRFRTLGCYPLTGAVESTATTLPEIIQEMLLTTTSERQGRAIDHDQAARMEKKKQEGYF